MEILEDLPESIEHIQRSLETFIKPRQETSRVRRILAAHLSTHVGLKNECLESRPLSIIDTASSGESLPSWVRGVRRDYIRAIRANIKARKEYDTIKGEHRLQDTEKPDGNPHQIHGNSGVALESFIDVVTYRRKHERLGIIQDYFDVLARKPAADANYLDPQVVLKDVESLPKVPEEVMNPSGSHHDSERTDLKELVVQLERSVLRAKLLLKKEQMFLAKFKTGDSGWTASSVSQGRRLQALGMARNELINWIEKELAKAGETLDGSLEAQNGKATACAEKDYIESQLNCIQKQYLQYIKTRQRLTCIVNERLKAPSARTNDDISLQAENDTPASSEAMSHVIYPYLEELISISNEQKSTNQQKSHLTISLAKQLKEAGQGLDRLADESHLLLTHPLPSGGSHRKGPASFSDEISSHEKPNSSHRARAWVYASDSAISTTREVISEKLEDGKRSILDALRTLSRLHSLLGEELVEAKGGVRAMTCEQASTKDLWAKLDGQLGVIKMEE